jgi:hypothetical protein
MAKLELNHAKIVGQIQAQPFFTIVKLFTFDAESCLQRWKKFELQFVPSLNNSWH